MPVCGYSPKYALEDLVREILNEADVNMDKNLSKEELEEAFKKMGSRSAKFRGFLSRLSADTNHDGQISPSEINGLVAYIMEWYGGNKR